MIASPECRPGNPTPNPEGANAAHGTYNTDRAINGPLVTSTGERAGGGGEVHASQIQLLKLNTGPLVTEHTETLIIREDQCVEEEGEPWWPLLAKVEARWTSWRTLLLTK